MDCDVKTIGPSSIDSSDDRFLITTKIDSERLEFSISSIGLINPPILMQTGSSFIIVSGFRRIAACKSIGLEKITARVLPRDTTKLDCAVLAVADNSFQRQLNLVEQSRCLKMISHYTQLAEKLLLSLNLPDNPSIIKKLMILSNLPDKIKEHVEDGCIGLAVATSLGELGPKESVKLADLFADLKMGLNKQREVLSLLKEISCIEGIGIVDILNNKEIMGILDNHDLEKPQKTGMLRTLLKKKRFPNIFSAEARYAKLVKDLKLIPGIKLLHPKDFEGRAYSISINFSDKNKLDELRAELDRISENPVIENILSGEFTQHGLE